MKLYSDMNSVLEYFKNSYVYHSYLGCNFQDSSLVKRKKINISTKLEV